MALAIAEHLPRYTYDDYALWEGRWELIEGVPYSMSPQPNFYHQSISQRIATQLGNLFKGRVDYFPMLPIDWEINANTIVQPDNCVINVKPEGVKLTVPPVIVFEILSPSTAKKDREVKSLLYADARVPYYIIVDPDAKVAEIYALENGAFVLKSASATVKFKFDLPNFSFEFDFAAIW